MISVGRRRLVYAGGAAFALAAGYPLVNALEAESEDGILSRDRWRQGPFGPLRRDPHGILDLPEGFSYRVLQQSGSPMSDGFRVPHRPDGMACFALPTTPEQSAAWALMCNHENPALLSALGPFTSSPPPEAWPNHGMGGVTRLLIDPETITLRSNNLVLAGTVLNCAGGPSPWGWLSCEESVGPQEGLVFLCDPHAEAIAPPQPIESYGRFRHEAAVVDPSSHVAYLTEDREDSCLYRFVPHDPSRPFEGDLYAMRIRGRARYDTAQRVSIGDRLEIGWIRLEDSLGLEDTLRHRAQSRGAAIIARGEGATFDADTGRVIFTASSGGPRHTGQIFAVEPEGDGGELVLVAQSESRRDLDMPDNLSVAPDGTVYFCEDGGGSNYVRAFSRDGQVFDFARNALSRSELAGVCFSPDGRAMFLNLQVDGLTLAVTGPFA